MPRWWRRHAASVAALLLVANLALFLVGAIITHSPNYPAGVLFLSAGAVGAPSVASIPDALTGFYFPASGQMAASVSGIASTAWHSGGFMAGTDNTRDVGTISGSRFRDFFLARNYHSLGFLHVGTALTYQAHVVVIRDNGKGAIANLETLAGDRSLYLIDCQDPDACQVSLGETGIAVGQITRIVALSHANVTMLDSGSAHLAGALTLTPGQTVSLIYVINRSGDGNWYEISRSLN